MRYFSIVVVAALLALSISDSLNAASPLAVASGPSRGQMIQSFFVRAVTGPHRNRSVCYVCRYGTRPVVMVLMQGVDPNVAALLKAIDGAVDGNRVEGLRSFGVLVTDESSTAVPILQTLAFDERIRTPLSAATTTIASSGANNLHREAATTVVLYRHHLAVESLAFKRGELTDESIEDVIDAVGRLLEEKRPVAAR